MLGSHVSYAGLKLVLVPAASLERKDPQGTTGDLLTPGMRSCPMIE